MSLTVLYHRNRLLTISDSSEPEAWGFISGYSIAAVIGNASETPLLVLHPLRLSSTTNMIWMP